MQARRRREMALSADRVFTRLCVYSILFIATCLQSSFADDTLTYEVASSRAVSDSIQDALDMDMVFLYKKDQEEHIRRRRNATDPVPEPKAKDTGTAKKVPAGFNSTSSVALGDEKKAEKQSPKLKDASGAPVPSTPRTVPMVESSLPTEAPKLPPPLVPRNISSVPTPTQVVLSHGDMNGDGHSSEMSPDPDGDDMYPHDLSNSTLTQHGLNVTREDNHQYYDSRMITNATLANQLWVDMDDHPNVTINEMLSKAHRRAITVKLPFDFPFYGHLVRNVTIATGGFLYTGDYVHSWLAATQYIAPLMANFDTSLSNDSLVKYVNNGTSFTVEWCKVSLQDKPSAGPYTFQATLHKTGNIVFVYRDIPLFDIKDDHHPVKVGLSDAYIIDRTIFCEWDFDFQVKRCKGDTYVNYRNFPVVRRKTIYEYHRVNFSPNHVNNGTVIYLTAKPTCLDFKDCNSCLTHNTTFDCSWCVSAGRCSNGMDRHRQYWLQNNCDRTTNGSDENIISHNYMCRDGKVPSSSGTSSPLLDEGDAASPGLGDVAVPVFRKSINQIPESHSSVMASKMADESSHGGVFGVVGILFLVAVAVVGLWVGYAYRNPHTASGQFLIRHRPSQWGWRRGEARYTAATIHM